MAFKRSSGILLHPTSLPGKFGIGSLGNESYQFVDFLAATGQKLWQTLPLGPTGYGDSPYQCFSAFAGNPLLISLEKLVDLNLLTAEDLKTTEWFDEYKVDFGKVINFKYPKLRIAFTKFKNQKPEALKKDYDAFCKKQNYWLKDYSLFMALKKHNNGHPWSEWEKDIKFRKPLAIKKYEKQLDDEIGFHKFIQFLFFKQWKDLKSYANSKKINIVGDVPIFVASDSSDAWANPGVFYFDKELRLTKVAGVPPDYFSKTGQLWGNPLYNWTKLKTTGFKWWIQRFEAIQEVVDIIRVDHFRGFAGYWAVPFGHKTAEKGKWEKALGRDMFTAVKKKLGDLPILAEDLGVITPDVEKLRDDFKFPGMKILEFGFDSKEGSSYAPHAYESSNCVVYTGTHDNDTALGWFKTAPEADKKYFLEYANSLGHDISWDFIRLAFASVAVIALVPMQDVLSLGSEGRMNTPGTGGGTNWQWRYKPEQITHEVYQKLKDCTRVYRR